MCTKGYVHNKSKLIRTRSQTTDHPFTFYCRTYTRFIYFEREIVFIKWANHANTEYTVSHIYIIFSAFHNFTDTPTRTSGETSSAWQLLLAYSNWYFTGVFSTYRIWWWPLLSLLHNSKKIRSCRHCSCSWCSCCSCYYFCAVSASTIFCSYLFSRYCCCSDCLHSQEFAASACLYRYW